LKTAWEAFKANINDKKSHYMGGISYYIFNICQPACNYPVNVKALIYSQRSCLMMINKWREEACLLKLPHQEGRGEVDITADRTSLRYSRHWKPFGGDHRLPLFLNL
jgi:hypothetical protein